MFPYSRKVPVNFVARNAVVLDEDSQVCSFLCGFVFVLVVLFLYLFHNYSSVICELRDIIFRNLTGEQLENTYLFLVFKFESL